MATVAEIRELLKNTKEEIIASIILKFDKKFDDFKKEIEGKVSEATNMVNDMKKEYDTKLEESVKRSEKAEKSVKDLEDVVTTLKNGGFPDSNEWEGTEDTLACS